MATNQTLELLLKTVPAEKQQCLDKKVEDRRILARVASNITDWPIAANFFAEVTKSDVEAIKHDNLLSLQQQK